MAGEEHGQATRLFLEAVKLDPEERRRFLQKACANDPEARAEVESLLAHDATGVLGTRSFTEQIRGMLSVLGTDPDPGQIGPYKILQVLGEGGMGIVYLADQERPVRRRVAIKLIKWGMDTKQVVARFESERQALALMDHPAIAKVFDAGSTEDGRPYFVMEYIEGVPITKYCDRHRLTTHQRLELFLQICEGVQHAHQRAIIHRDLKPSNVLVSIQDTKATPKIIDFGVAKATAQRLTEKTLFTELGVMIGTPEYMSPEQAELAGQDVDTRTDVYSLGVMLYELLVGALPFDPKELRQAGFDEIRRRIREEEPSRPSARLSTLGDKSTESAKSRKTDLPTLRRQLRGDLDWITMRALEKDRARRYGSPNELATDIRRHLANMPVVAGPPTPGYRTRKFVKRHRVAVAASTAIGLSLLVGAILATIGMVRANRAELAARREASTAKEVVEFLVGTFRDLNLYQPGAGGKITVRHLLDAVAKKIDGELVDQPAVKAALLDVFATLYEEGGMREEATALLEKALHLRESYLDPEHREIVATLSHVGEVLETMGRYAEAESYLTRAMEISEQSEGVDATTLRALGWLHGLQANFAEAEPLVRRACEIQEHAHRTDYVDLVRCLESLSDVYAASHQMSEGLRVVERALAIGEDRLGPNHPALLGILHNLGFFHSELGNYEEGESYYRRRMELAEAIGLPRKNNNAVPSIGRILIAQGRYDEAETLFLEFLDLLDSTGATNGLPYYPELLSEVALLHFRQGRFDEAERFRYRAIDESQDTRGRYACRVGRELHTLAMAYASEEKLDAAERIIKQSLAVLERSAWAYDPHLENALLDYGTLLRRTGRTTEAEPLELRARTMREARARESEAATPDRP